MTSLKERISDVTVTAYWIESDGSDTFFDTTPSDDTYGTKWDADEWDQSNPLTTDINGCYSWDVPGGWWRVKYEKTGYETTWSDWMPVPPPQTEVNIAMNEITYYGDINRDGTIDGKDVIRLKNYLANYNTETGMSTISISKKNADCNGDNTIDENDITYLKQYLQNYDFANKTSSIVLGPKK